MNVPSNPMSKEETEVWWKDIYEKIEKDKKVKAVSLAEQRPLILEGLRALLLTGQIENPIEIKYEGYGDSGGIEEKPDNLPNDVEEYLWEIIWNREAGFEINEGGYGYVYWDINEDKITMNHVEFVTETVERDYEI